ncbi:hypothetical protein B0A55_04752 [Friedmanniomyces simplex]|uniref:Peptidase S33 tripeptidyl aminopeptidase-like C-terminal domain-containing protein n=1 Tax=Friedmanniomyces simplex TaxID=329884 RepID=A0A4U0XRP3_9PEZI|nr:hypothetical protein B0A55_04752 [Friedmanniomyces simplex]
MYFDRLSSLFLQSSAWLEGQIPLSSPFTSAAVPSHDFLWDDITPSKHFVWHPCFGDFECARLQVPMDWQGTSTEANKTVDLGVVKVEAMVPVTDPKYGGAVVMNPGGPGGSGVGQVLRGGHHVRTILSAGPAEAADLDARYFDIIGFDPRGINNTQPILTCFPNRIEAAIYSLEEEAHGYIGTSDTSFDNLWASKRAVAEGCSKKTAEEGIAKHMSTATVARDIVEIFERHGEWREQEATRLLSSMSPENVLAEQDRDIIISRTAWIKDAEKLQYWGFSYGSILGATLATMYPERIYRALLDGIADSHDYMAGGWSTNLQDTDVIMVKLAEHCWDGGKTNCPIWDEDGPAVILTKVQETIAGLQKDPIGMPAEGDRGPAVVTWNDLLRLIRDIVYEPIREFPLTARVLHDLSERNGTSLATWIRSQRPAGLGEPLSQQCETDGPYSPACFATKEGGGPLLSWEATYGIACSDGPGDRLNQTKEEFKEYVDRIMAQSKLIGAGWATIQLPCTVWHARPHWRYEGDFRNQTAVPVLFASTSIDPVTPLANAFRMAEGFEGAGVLQQDSEGHSTYSGISMCSMKAIREYFQSGKLPGETGGLENDYEWKGHGALCEVDRKPFDGYDAKGPVPELPEGETDAEMWEALVGLNRVWP